jgi:hypothetical protein
MTRLCVFGASATKSKNAFSLVTPTEFYLLQYVKLETVLYPDLLTKLFVSGTLQGASPSSLSEFQV